MKNLEVEIDEAKMSFRGHNSLQSIKEVVTTKKYRNTLASFFKKTNKTSILNGGKDFFLPNKMGRDVIKLPTFIENDKPNAYRTTINDADAVNSMDIDDAIVTIKNYNIKKGLSKAMFDMVNEDLESPIIEVQGPMGKGLEIQKTGVHIAYTAGTGILVFMDLVAHLIRKNLGILSEEDDKLIDGKNFKFILYGSFPNEAECMGVDLAVGLCHLCSKVDIPNFEFKLRLSNTDKQRWNDFLIW